MIKDDKHLTEYFGKQSDYYLAKYKEFHSGRKFTFNISAFAAGIFWFLYRKLFVQAFVIVVILFLVETFEEMLYEKFSINPETRGAISVIASIAIAITLGFIGNYFYLRKSDNEIREIVGSTMDEDERIKLLQQKGGVSWSSGVSWALVLLGLLVILILTLIGTLG